MAKAKTTLFLEVVAWKAQPAPPLGPMLGANGVNIGAFIKEFNDKTMDYMKEYAWADVKIKAKLEIFVDRTYKLTILGPVTSSLIKRKLNIKKGSGEPNTNKIGTIKRADLEAIADIQKDTMNTTDKEAIISIIANTAKNMGLDIEHGAVLTKEERMEKAAA